MDMDPFKVLGVDKRGFTLEQLKKNYKKLVLKYHPDRTADISKSNLFQTLTFHYNYLLKHLEELKTDADHMTLKNADRKQDKKQNITISKDKFNLHTFNEEFSKVKELNKDEYDEGYSSWKEDAVPHEQAIINYKDPEPLTSARFGNSYELGVAKITDFSGTIGTYGYMDYKLAHTTTKLVDANHVTRKTSYNSIDDLKKERSQISYTPTPAELQKLHTLRKLDQTTELARREKLKQNDTLISALYDKTHKAMLQLFT
jgi:DnaJ family protein A protein 5